MRSGSPFYHFRSKQELLKEAILDGLAAGQARITAASADIADPVQRLRVMVRTYLATLLDANCTSPMLLSETRSPRRRRTCRNHRRIRPLPGTLAGDPDDLPRRTDRFSCGAAAPAAVRHAQLVGLLVPPRRP